MNPPKNVDLISNQNSAKNQQYGLIATSKVISQNILRLCRMYLYLDVSLWPCGLTEKYQEIKNCGPYFA